MSELYNQEIKEQFLNEFYSDSEPTQRIVWFVFKRFAKFENAVNRDIYTFTREEIREFLESTRPFNLSMAKRDGTYLFNYISWSIENGLRKGNINPLSRVSDDFFESTLDKNKKILFSMEEFEELVEQLPNAQDQVLLLLIWHGIIGEELKEIIGLRYENIDWNNNKVTIRNRLDNLTKEHVDVEFTFNNRMMYFLERAHTSTNYYPLKSDSEKSKQVLPSDYILKRIRKNTSDEDTPVSMNTLYTRINSIKNFLELEYLTTNSIKQSGMLYMAYDLIANKKKYPGLTTQLYQEIGKKYNYAIIKSGDSYIYNSGFMARFINEENLKKLYDLEL